VLKIAGDELQIEIDVERGSRIVSLTWKGLEFVVQERPNLMDWGMYAMVPWAGRIRNGLIANASGEVFTLPTHWDPPHAEHGFGFFSAWEEFDKNCTRLKLPSPYAPAVAEQTFEIDKNSLRWSIAYFSNGCTLPAWVGFHPWFRRTLGGGRPAQVMFRAEKMLVRGGDMLPTGEVSTPKPPPWDDAFTGLAENPTIRWPGSAMMTIASDAPWWVVYTEDNEGVCIEPQSAPPDASNLGMTGAHRLEATFSFAEG
jgi:aldose 1-epimerase